MVGLELIFYYTMCTKSMAAFIQPKAAARVHIQTGHFLNLGPYYTISSVAALPANSHHL